MARRAKARAYGSLGVQMSGPVGRRGPLVGRSDVDRPRRAESRWSAAAAGRRSTSLVQARAVDPGDRCRAVERRADLRSVGTRRPRSLGRRRRRIGQARPRPDWVDAARSVELAETIDRSLQKSTDHRAVLRGLHRGRDVQGTMTSLGCGLLFVRRCSAGRRRHRRTDRSAHTRRLALPAAGVIGSLSAAAVADACVPRQACRRPSSGGRRRSERPAASTPNGEAAQLAKPSVGTADAAS